MARYLSPKQQKAIAKIQEALIELGRARLMGGVYSGSFCVWPEDSNSLIEPGPSFFEDVEEFGIILNTPGVNLDGGAGV